MVLIRKNTSGNDSFGNEWPEPGAVVDVDPDEAQQLLAIADGGFSVAEPKPEGLHVVNPDDGPQASIPDLDVLAAEQPHAVEDEPSAEDEAPEDLTEGPAEPEQPVDEAPAPTRRGTRGTRKN